MIIDLLYTILPTRNKKVLSVVLNYTIHSFVHFSENLEDTNKTLESKLVEITSDRENVNKKLLETADSLRQVATHFKSICKKFLCRKWVKVHWDKVVFTFFLLWYISASVRVYEIDVHIEL